MKAKLGVVFCLLALACVWLAFMRFRNAPSSVAAVQAPEQVAGIEATQHSAQPVEPDNLPNELRKRFAAAMATVVAAPLEAWDAGGLLAVHFLERDYAVKIGADQLTASVVASGKAMPGLVRVAPKGLAMMRPVENKIGLEWVRKEMDIGLPLSDEATVIFATVSAVSHCLPVEKGYNVRFLEHVNTLPWPENTEWVRFGLYAGFRLHECIGQAEFEKQVSPLVPHVVALLENPGVSKDIKTYILFGLASSKRLTAVSSHTLFAFVRSQTPQGAWLSENANASPVSTTALGAYVVAAMLHGLGEPLPRTDFRVASLAPVASPIPPSSHGEVHQ